MLLNKVYAVIIGIEVVSPPRIFSHEGSHVLFDLRVQPRFLKERLVDLFRDHGAKLRLFNQTCLHRLQLRIQPKYYLRGRKRA